MSYSKRKLRRKRKKKIKVFNNRVIKIREKAEKIGLSVG